MELEICKSDKSPIGLVTDYLHEIFARQLKSHFADIFKKEFNFKKEVQNALQPLAKLRLIILRLKNVDVLTKYTHLLP